MAAAVELVLVLETVELEELEEGAELVLDDEGVGVGVDEVVLEDVLCSLVDEVVGGGGGGGGDHVEVGVVTTITGGVQTGVGVGVGVGVGDGAGAAPSPKSQLP